MERENKAMAGRQLILIRDPGGGQKEFWTASLCVCVCAIERGGRGEETLKGGDGREKKKQQRLTHILPLVHSFFFTGSVWFRIKRRGGHPLGPRGRGFFPSFFPLLSSFFFLPLLLPLPPRSTPFMHRCADKRSRVHAKTKRDDHPVNPDNENEEGGGGYITVYKLLENGLITVCLRN